ncbi:hypothetical protein ACFCZ6_36445 [Streptomyces hydrogenans]|uniref:hypothetical protein n=1 Tax=Streptomyces hydrogenans TaxID=1873719 RepID=UPI0035D5C0DA
MTSGTGQLPDARPVLQRWLTNAPLTHPVRVMEAAEGTNPSVRASLDTLETMVSALDTAGAGDARWRKKIVEFGKLASMGQFLEMRAEFVLALALSGAKIGYQLGDTTVSNPDILVQDRSGSALAGIEVTARAPQNINELVEQVESASGGLFDVSLTFDRYPSRLQPAIVKDVVAAVRTLAAGDTAVGQVVPVDDPKNAGPVKITVQVGPGTGVVRWEVAGGVLDSVLGASEYAVFEAGIGEQKAAQGGSLGGTPVLLVVDVSRYGAAWLRPGTVWAQRLAGHAKFTPVFPFAGIAVMRQSLDQPSLVDVGVGLSPHLPRSARQTLQDLCKTLDWPCA